MTTSTQLLILLLVLLGLAMVYLSRSKKSPVSLWRFWGTIARTIRNAVAPKPKPKPKPKPVIRIPKPIKTKIDVANTVKENSEPVQAAINTWNFLDNLEDTSFNAGGKKGGC